MTITDEQRAAYRAYLRRRERAAATVERYMAIIDDLARHLGDKPLAKEALVEWRDCLAQSTGTINVAISAANGLAVFLGRPDLKLRHRKRQRRVYRPAERELTRQEYERLIRTAEAQGRERLARVIETICSLGLRVSELGCITVEALDKKEVTIRCKGKERTVMLNAKLLRKLRAYCKKHGVTSGPVFVTRTGRALGRKQIWAEMKSLCETADVSPGKVFPHNLRHLFAVTHYRQHKDVVRLADLLGHSNVNTTRIYLMTSGEEHRQELENMGLVLPDAA